MAKAMRYFSKDPINPLIGAAGVSAVPMAARVVNKVGLDNNNQNFLLMHAMGPNVSGVIGSAVAAVCAPRYTWVSNKPILIVCTLIICKNKKASI